MMVTSFPRRAGTARLSGLAALVTALFVAVVLPGCGGDATKSVAAVDAGAVDVPTRKADVVQASCVGIASASRQLFSQYDDQCEFLKDCPSSGKCYCGDGCSATKTPCAAALCTGVDSDCWCGDECANQTGKVQCPEYVCKDLAITGCEKQAGCKYIGQEMADKCKCNTMPETAPPCFCGTTCSADKLACIPAKCVGKNPSKCIIVQGSKHTTPYCALCGLLGGNPKCFFVISP